MDDIEFHGEPPSNIPTMVVAFAPVPAPAPDRGACRAEAAGHVGGRQALRQQEDHVGSEAQVLGCLMGTNQCVERVALLL